MYSKNMEDEKRINIMGLFSIDIGGYEDVNIRRLKMRAYNQGMEKTKRINVILFDSQYERIREISEETDLKISAIIRRAINLYFRELEKVS